MRVEIEATSARTGKTTTIAATFNTRELAVELFEALSNHRRPDGMSWQDAYAEIGARLGEETAEDMRRAAERAMQYFARRMRSANQDGEPVQ